MSKVFLFGHMYDTNEANFEKTKESLYNSKTSYEVNKNTFIVSFYDNEATMKVSYNKLKKNVVPIEIVKDKDLMDFTITELMDLMNSIPTSSYDTKRSIYHLIDNYLDWNVSLGNISVNNLKGLPKEDLCRVSKKVASYKVMDKKTLLEHCERFINSDEISVVDLMPLIMARYGIVGEKLSWIINLKYADLDYDNKIVRIQDGENTVLLPVDDDFFVWVDRCHMCEKLDGNPYIETDYIIKKTTKVEVDITDIYLYNRIDKVFKTTSMPRVSFKLLEFSRKIDFLLDIREDRVLTSEDFRDISRMFNPNISISSANTLIKAYETLTGDKVQPMRSKNKVKYTDDNPSETTQKIREQIGYTKGTN